MCLSFLLAKDNHIYGRDACLHRHDDTYIENKSSDAFELLKLRLQNFFLKRKNKRVEKQKNRKEKNLGIAKTFKTNSPIECNANSTSLPAAKCVKGNEKQDKKTLKPRNLSELNANSTFLPAAECVKGNEKQDKKTLKPRNLSELNANSTFLLAAECVKGNEKQDKKTLKPRNLSELNANSTFLPAAECVKGNTGGLA